MTDTDLEQTAELTERAAPTELALSQPVERMLQMACDDKLDAGKLEKLVNLQLQIMDRQAVNDFNRDMAMFKEACPSIPRDAHVSYATKAGGRVDFWHTRLETLMKVVNPVLFPLGFSYRFTQRAEDGKERTVCVLTHKAGHSTESMARTFPTGTPTMSEAQKDKGGMKIAQRAALEGVLGLTTEGEDDNPLKNVKTIDAEQAANIHALVDEVGNPRIIKNILTLVGVEKVEEVPADRYREIVKMLQAKVK